MPSFLWTPKADAPFHLTAGQLADWFLDIHSRWFLDAMNDLRGRRGSCHNALVAYLKTGESPPSSSPEGYVVMKFRNEAEGWFVKGVRPS